MHNSARRILVKRGFLHFNLGGEESNNIIKGNSNNFSMVTRSKNLEDETLLRRTGHEFGRVLQGGADLAVAPAKFLAHIQENW